MKKAGTRIGWPILDVAVELSVFVKTHEYPKEMSEDFFELMRLFDKLETALRAELMR